MGTQVLQDCKLWVGEFDLSGDMNSISLEYGADMLDDTVFGDDTKSNKGGLKTVKASHAGLWNGGTDAVDDVLFSKMALADSPMTISPVNGSVGDVSYMFKSNISNYSPGAAVGELFKFTVTAESTDKLIRGTLAFNTAATTSGNGTGYQLGAVSSTQRLYAAVHVTATSGTSETLDVIIQSDDNGSFTSASSQITFTQATGVTSEFLSAAGAITDDYFRVNYTIGGTGSPSFTFTVTIGII